MPNLPTFDRVPSAVVLDLDGTVLDSTPALRARTRTALEGVIATGIPVVIATARAVRSVNVYLSEELVRGLRIAHLNGAVVHHGSEQLDPVWHTTLNRDVAERVAHVALSMLPGARVVVELDGREFGSNVVLSPDVLWATNRATPEMVLPLGDALARRVAKLAIRAESSVATFIDHVQREFGAHIAVQTDRFDPQFVQIVSRNCSKETGVRAALAVEATDSPTDWLAIGDDLPDLGMLQCSRFGVAMGNAHPDLIRAIPYSTLGNDEDGAAVVLEHLLATLGERR